VQHTLQGKLAEINTVLTTEPESCIAQLNNKDRLIVFRIWPSNLVANTTTQYLPTQLLFFCICGLGHHALGPEFLSFPRRTGQGKATTSSYILNNFEVNCVVGARGTT